MDFSEKSKIAFVLFMVSGYLNTVAADPRTSIADFSCNTSLTVSGAALAKTFVLAMSNLNNMINQNGHGTTVVGEVPSIVFGLAQCLKDLNSTDCRLCFSEIRSVLPRCYPNTGGRIFLDGCFGRYENFSFFHESMDSHNSKVCSFDRNSSQPDEFRETVKSVAVNVSLEAQRSRGFAVGSVSSPNITLYALAQCWDNLDKESCSTCLQSAVSSIVSCSPAFEGRALNAGCYMRYSTRIFWNLNQTSPNPEGKGGNLWIILVSVFGSFFLLAGIVILKAKRYLCATLCRSSKDSDLSGLPASISQSELNFRYQELRNATKNFDASNKLGQGSYGSVYKGVLPDGREIAVKRLFLNTRQWIDQFFNEVNMVNQVRHKNLVKLLGCNADGPESLLVYEYYFNKSLDQFIFEKSRAHLLDWQKRFDIIQGVAEGLRYLHEGSEVRIVHRDIKASNILLDNKFKPKITDFGLARSFAEDQTHLSTGIAGTLGYMAPEYVVHGHLTEKADVYSFGILILEIVTGQRCGNAIDAQAKQFFLAKIWSHYKDNTVHRIIDRSFYDDGIKDEILHVVHVGLLCTQATPGYRPAMAKVVELLRSNEDEGNLSPTDPPFLNEIVMDSHMRGEDLHLLSSASAPNFSGSSESFYKWEMSA